MSFSKVTLFIAIVLSSSDPTDEMVRDRRLQEKVASALSKGVSLDKIETFVGEKATINTSRPDDRAGLRLLAIDVDPKESQVESICECKDVVFWIRPVGGSGVKIIGVVWTRDNEMKLFRASVLSPR